MKTYPSAQSLGFFDVELRVQWLEAKGNPLGRLDAVIDWEGFRPLLAQALAKPAKGPDAHTLWDFREALVSAGVFEKLFEQFAQQLRAQGRLVPRTGDWRRTQHRVSSSPVELTMQKRSFVDALHWAAAQCGGNGLDQPDLQPGPLRTDCAVEAAATNRRLKSED